MSKKNLDFVGRNIKMWRTARKLTQEELAVKSNMAQSTITQLESAKRGFSMESLKRVADALGMPVTAVFEENSSIKLIKSHDKKAGQKSPMTQYVILMPGTQEKNPDKKKAAKKEMLELINQLPENVTKRYLRLMKTEANKLKRGKS